MSWLGIRGFCLTDACLLLLACNDAAAPAWHRMPDPVLSPDTRVIAIGAGFSSTCALVQSGRLYCWGENRFGELGIGTDSADSVPTPAHLDSLAVLAVGTQGTPRSCALTASGAAYCWGYNLNGELGDGSNVDRWLPTPVTGELRFRSIATSYHTCGISSDSVAYCWGLGLGGALGLGSQSSFNTPQAVHTSRRFLAVGTGMEFTCALDPGGAPYCWGWSAMIGSVQPEAVATDTPIAVATTQRFVSLNVAEEHTCGLTATGSAYCWGSLAGPLADSQATPVRVPGLARVRAISGGRTFSCVLTADSTALCGNLGETLTPIADSIPFAGLSVGATYACGFTGGGAVFCWDLFFWPVRRIEIARAP